MKDKERGELSCKHKIVMNTHNLRANRTRNCRIEVNLNEKEYAHFLNQVDKSHLSKSAFMRSLITGQKITARQPEEYREVRRLVSNMANNINQIARVANTCGEVDKGEIQVLLQMIQKCWIHIKEL